MPFVCILFSVLLMVSAMVPSFAARVAFVLSSSTVGELAFTVRSRICLLNLAETSFRDRSSIRATNFLNRSERTASISRSTSG